MPPKVIHLVISLASGGLERLVVDWTNARNRRFPGSTSICCLDSLGDLASQVEGEAVTCVNAHRNRWPFDGVAVRKIVALLNTARTAHCPQSTDDSFIPVLHAHNLAAWQYGVLAKLWRETKSSFRLIYTQHGANVHNLGLRDRLRARLLACFTDEIVTVSKATAEVMSKKLWIARKRIKVVVNGVAVEKKPEVSSQKSGIREQLGITSNSRLIGAVGRLAWVKGHDRLIAAFAAVIGYSLEVTREKAKGDPSTNNQEPITNNGAAGAFLLLVGDGPERDVLEHQARDLAVADRVIFAGYQSEPGPYLAAMDVFVLPSRSEGLSVSLLEAMVAGVPVAVTDVGANREVIEDGKCGTMLPEDEGAWAEILEGILRDKVGTQTKAAAARTRVHDHYSLESTLDNYERLYVAAADKRWCGREEPRVITRGYER